MFKGNQSTARLSALVVVVSLLFILNPASTHADELRLTLGAFGGAHITSDKNELGVADGSGGATLDNSVMGGLRAAYFILPRLGIELEGGILPTKARDTDVDYLAFVWRAHALVHLFEADRSTRPFALLGFGGLSGLSDDETVIADDADFVVHAGLGVEQHIASGWGLRGDARLLLPPSTASKFVTVDWEILLGVYKSFGQPASTPPAAPSDSDGDGLLDPDDACPQEAEDKDGFEDENGCPDLDNDSDGIEDSADECPNDAEDKDGFEDENGCPDVDNDADGIEDSADECPNDAEDKDGFEDQDGCPDPDNDGDGILDASDKCISEPETKNGFEDEDGCPDVVPAQVKKFVGTIAGIRFSVNGAKIRRSSFALLDEAVAVLKEYPELKLEIQGHTDDRGDDAYNMDLSQRRAASVRQYFIDKEIAEGRLSARGLGKTQPEVEGKSSKARTQNRRVVFVLIQ